MANRRVYRDIADSIKKSLDRDDTCSDTVALVARSIATDFKRDRSEFRYDKFFDACGLDSFGYVDGTKHENFVAKQYASTD